MRIPPILPCRRHVSAGLHSADTLWHASIDFLHTRMTTRASRLVYVRVGSGRYRACDDIVDLLIISGGFEIATGIRGLRLLVCFRKWKPAYPQHLNAFGFPGPHFILPGGRWPIYLICINIALAYNFRIFEFTGNIGSGHENRTKHSGFSKQNVQWSNDDNGGSPTLDGHRCRSDSRNFQWHDCGTRKVSMWSDDG